MRVPALHSPRLTLFSLALAAGLAGCQSANPAEPGDGVSMDPAPMALQQNAGPAAAITLQVPTPVVLHPICRVLSRPVGSGAGNIRVCTTAHDMR